MDNISPEGNEYQPVISSSGEYLGSDIHLRHLERIRKYSQQHDPGFGSERDQKSDIVVSNG